MAFNTGTSHSPKNAASPILNDTSYVCLYTSYNQNSYKECIRTYIILTQLLDGKKGHHEETHRLSHRFRRLFLDLLLIGWRGCASAMEVIKLPPSCSSPKLISQVIQFNLCSGGFFGINNFKLRNFYTVLFCWIYTYINIYIQDEFYCRNPWKLLS